MRQQPLFWGIHANPRQLPMFATLLALLPFVIAVIWWFLISSHGDRFFPTFGQMYDAILTRLRPGEFSEPIYIGIGSWQFDINRVLLLDTFNSLYRLIVGTSLGAFLGLAWGLYLGSFPGLRQTFGSITTFLSLVVVSIFQPLIVNLVGFDDVGKISLIAFGVVFFIALSVFQAVKSVPKELQVKALTMGHSTFGLIHRVILPMILPRWLTALRFALLIAWTFLIMSEFISSEYGLGHEVFKSKRQLQMYVIIPYGLWATILACTMDRLLLLAIQIFYPWYKVEE